jgi:hypothetical protein
MYTLRLTHKPLQKQTKQPDTTHIHTHRTQTNQDNNTNFNLAIARPKLDFPTFAGEEPINWFCQCEKYFTLANAPMDTWVPLATLHCHGMAQT